MARVFAAAKVMFAVALTLANAVCFVQCLAQPCDGGAMPCHSHGPAKAHVCQPQHGFRAAVVTLTAATPALKAAIPIDVSDRSIGQQPNFVDKFSGELPPLASSKPLRI